MKRIYVPHAQLGPCQLDKSAHHYLAHVLRCHTGEHLEVFDGEGKSFLARIEALGAKDIHLSLLQECAQARDSSVGLMQAVLRQPARFEWLLQKATELGVEEFWPLLTERTQQHQAPSEKRFSRWQKILEEAARQSHRNHIPKLHPCLSLRQALQLHPEGTLLLLNESETYLPLREALATGAFRSKLRLLVGPEGGWTPTEVALAKQQGALSVGLGPCILKSETAGVAALSILQFVAGQLG